VNKYEYLYILDPQEEAASKAIQRLKDHYSRMGLRLLKEEEMGKRRLAYEINKKTDGYYYTTQIEVDDFKVLREFERELKHDPDIIRFLKFRI